ncbi:Xaa-pro aminopeptidase PepP [Clostridium aceticum]|uniref:Xaa-pro aminopeptidase PepP n=1 Tax=Clostridium aceticum TaxID=84022 RepID=A0A0D8IDF9_9CLOT|nr:Xaa-Pro peptidase family protein [Clostridium aceticum]AKL95287.1 Xaa-pro aminopeptidase PepP [Clostridium aceticum]KJF28134.1 Xaa-Pro dipeptidase [Clostridium aceticum]
MNERINKLREVLNEKKLEAVLVFKPENRRYFSNFTGTTGFVLITNTEAKFITDFRYVEQAKNQCKGYEIVEVSRLEPLTTIIEKMNLKTIGIEEEFFTYGHAVDFLLKLKDVKLEALEGALTKIRAVKSQEEISCIAKAASLADEAFHHVLPLIRPGVVETEIALELEFFMRKNGAIGASFDFIVASGVRSSLPHGVASEKVIEAGDFVTLDYGCIYKGYCSDMTRTVVVGKANDKQKEIYATVLEAQETALKAVRPGFTGKELDSIARKVIGDKGYGEYFGHGLGHGVGLEIHELPHVNMIGNLSMTSGMVITIEPGIYIPDFGGVRIEDLVVVTDDGYEVLSKTPKELIEIQI